MAIRVGALPSAGLAFTRTLSRTTRPGATVGSRVRTGGTGAAAHVLSDAAALSVAGAVLAPRPLPGAILGALSLGALLLVASPSRSVSAAGRTRLGAALAAAMVPAVLVGMLFQPTQPLLRQAVLGAALVLAGRIVSASVVRSRRARGHRLTPTLIVGSGRLGRDVASVLGQHPEYGLLPVGFVDETNDASDLPLPLVGTGRSLAMAVREHMVGEVVVADGAGSEENLVPILRECQELGVTVRVIPRFSEMGAEGHSDDVWGLPLVTLRRPARHSAAWAVKRAIDVAVALTGLILAAPVMLAVAAAVKLTSPGPVLFRQVRVGLGGLPIEVLKFRSMRVNEDSATCWTVAGDSRVTAVGRLMRRTSLDELPQLFNILRGDMSLVGPRPERPHFVEQFGSEIRGYDARHRVPVGLTGWAAVNGLRGDTSIVERSRFDNRYIESWSLGRDLSILARTLPAVLRDARRQG